MSDKASLNHHMRRVRELAAAIVELEEAQVRISNDLPRMLLELSRQRSYVIKYRKRLGLPAQEEPEEAKRAEEKT